MKAHQGLALIIGNMKADKSGQNPQEKQSKLKEALAKLSGESEKDDISDEDKYKAAMQDLMDAFKNNDVGLAMEAYSDVMKLCPEEEKEEEHYDTEDTDSSNGMTMED